MKTTMDFIEHELWKQSKNGKQTLPVGTIMRIMREYAKQWIDKAFEIPDITCFAFRSVVKIKYEIDTQ